MTSRARKVMKDAARRKLLTSTRNISKKKHSPTGSSSITKPVRKGAKTQRFRDTHTPTPTFQLFDLPQELIDMIIIRMLRAGHFNILHTSRFARARALEFLEREGVYRVVADDRERYLGDEARAVYPDEY